MTQVPSTKNQALKEFSRHADIKRLEFILQAIKKHVGESGSILDVGCGNGVISRFLGQHGYSILGIDISEKTIAEAAKLNNYPNVQFRVLSAEAILADGKKYDAVICSEVLEHLHDPNKLLQTLQDVVTENGILIVTVPNGKGPREVLVTKPVITLQQKQNFSWKILNKMKNIFGYAGTTSQSSADDLTHIQFFSKKDVLFLAKDNGFTIIEFANSNFIDDVFPFSLVTRRLKWAQRVDSKLADILPNQLAGGFFTVWKKKKL